MGLAIGMDITIGGGAGGGATSIGDFILTENGQKISTENYEPLIQQEIDDFILTENGQKISTENYEPLIQEA